MNTQKQLLRKLKQPLYLPTLQELKTAFPRKDSHRVDSKEFPWLSPSFSEFEFKYNNFQVYTKEFISSLGTYLKRRVETLHIKTKKTVLVLEVGAGDGRLSYFLQSELAELIHQKKAYIKASDTKEWEDRGKTNSALQLVERLDYKAALKATRAQPTLVISCWMNINVDWTPTFRKASHVFEYILIGDLFRTAHCGAGYFPDFCQV